MAESSSHEKLPPFLRKTWDIVEDHTTDHIVRWSTSGRSFVVLDVESFAKEILPRFFKHSNWSSFVRQLNTYGFRKIDPDRWEFANENFTKGGKDHLSVIQRRKPTLTSTMTALVGQARAPEVGAGAAALQQQQAAAAHGQHSGHGQQQHSHGQPHAQSPHAQQGPHAPMQNQHHQQQPPPGIATPDYMLAQPYPLDLRHTPVPLFHGPSGATTPPAAAHVPQPAAGLYGFGMRPSSDGRVNMGNMGSMGNMPMQGIVFAPDAVQMGAANHLLQLQRQQSNQQQQQQQQQSAFQQQQSVYQQAQQQAAQQVAQQNAYQQAQQNAYQQQQNAYQQQSSYQQQQSSVVHRNDQGSMYQQQQPQQQQQQQQPHHPHKHYQAGHGHAHMHAPTHGATNMQVQMQGRDANMPPSAMDRVSAMMEEYMKPGQRILANMQQPMPVDVRGIAVGPPSHPVMVVQDSHSTSTGSAGPVPSCSTEDNGDTEEVRKISKRGRADLHGKALHAAGSSSSGGGPDTVESALVANTSLDKDGIPLPPGITRPKPQAAGMAAQSLISEMAGQIGRLGHLASEQVQELKDDNTKLRQGMDAMLHRQPHSNSTSEGKPRGIQLDQGEPAWQFKSSKSEESNMQQQSQHPQQYAQPPQTQTRSTGSAQRLEAQVAQQRKVTYNTAAVARTLEAQNVDLARKLAAQENINLQQHSSNQALEARVLELEQQLSGRQERMLKGLEDRMMAAMTEMLSGGARKAAEAAGRGAGGSTAAAAALAEDLKASLSTSKPMRN